MQLNSYLKNYLILQTFFKKRIYDLKHQCYLNGRFSKVYKINSGLVYGAKYRKSMVYKIKNFKIISLTPQGAERAFLIDSLHYVYLAQNKTMVTIARADSSNPIYQTTGHEFNVLENHYIYLKEKSSTQSQKHVIYDIAEHKPRFIEHSNVSVHYLNEGMFALIGKTNQRLFDAQMELITFETTADSKITPFSCGNKQTLLFEQNKSWYLSKDGVKRDAMGYSEISPLDSHTFMAQVYIPKGLVSAEGEILLPEEFQTITHFKDNIVQLYKGNSVQYYDVLKRQHTYK